MWRCRRGCEQIELKVTKIGVDFYGKELDDRITGFAPLADDLHAHDGPVDKPGGPIW
ncbi:MAG: hypothetical protein ABSG56_35275 [Bryobacteraceae bacterium]